MQRRRVGTLTLGTALIVCGIVLVAARIQGNAAAGLVIAWWPLFLVMLGGEVLWHHYTAKDGNTRLYFDIFSILTVGLIIFCSLGLFTLTEIGVLPRLQAVLASQSYSLRTPVHQIAVDAAVQKVVVSAPHSRLVLRAGADRTISAGGKADILATSLAQAEGRLDNLSVEYRQEGDTMYVTFSYPYGGSLGQDIRVEEFAVTVPGDLAVEVNEPGSLWLDADRIKADWLIDAAGYVEIRLSADSDVRVETDISDAGRLDSDMAWVEEDEPEETDGMRMVKRTAGNGKYKIKVPGAGHLSVNRID